MRTKGLNRKAVLAELAKAREQDLKYADGRILCSMCTEPHPMAKKAQQLFSSSNLGDPGLFPGSQRLEKEVIKNLAALLNGENCAGFLVSGGTEANLLALLAARNRANVSNPEVVLPESAHFSLTKACKLLGLKAVQASLDDSFRVDVSSVEQHINKHTVAIVGTAGTSELGAVDPIGKLSEIALSHGVYLHVDAAFGGLIIPFLKDAGEDEAAFDFRLEGVQSITVDPHKMGLTTIPAGGILFRDHAILDYLRTETPYLTEDCQHTFVGTRPGGSAAAAWAVFQTLGREGFEKTVKHCIGLTRLLASELKTLGFTLVAEPTLNIVAFRGSDTNMLSEKLRGRGWLVSYVPRLDCIRLVVMPHLKRRHVAAFLEDLKTIKGESF
ncbi:MAG: tyrosine decarboxylase MfnA [Candidatus Bathyarchaeota archaeon]|nr:tyrosine decarboxylase MfnA [Candidatus Bathyarchaeota archaeon]